MLAVDRLNKRYPSFALTDVSFEIPAGYIVGFIGINGAGKTTTLKSILNLTRPDSGHVTFLGEDLYAHEVELKQKIGFTLGPVDFYPKHSVRKVVDVYRRFYDEWDGSAFAAYLDRFGVDDGKKICDLSSGMRVKLGIALALSHGARLIILDEPTSGLDPVARDQLLDLLREVVDDGERSVLFSTHITSDLDKCADYVIFIRDGRVIAYDTKDDLVDRHALVSGRLADLSGGFGERLVGYKTSAFGFSGLALRSQLDSAAGAAALQVAEPSLEDLMLYYNLEADHAQ